MRPPTDTTVVDASRYQQVRRRTEAITAPLCVEDHVVQTIDDVSPPKWHLAHTTWFFETFVLAPNAANHRPFDPHFGFLFNSYYEAVGPRAERAARGALSRPTLARVHEYRRAVDEQMHELLAAGLPAKVAAIVELGLQHEQQHQELLVTDIKHILASNPERPAYRPAPEPAARGAAGIATHRGAARWRRFDGGLVEIGHDGAGFGFDNETPRHRVWLEPFDLADRLVTNAEYLQFVEDGGYARAELWLSDGWSAVQRLGWYAPLYWERDGDGWSETTLHGRAPLEPDAPVVHVSGFESDAFARWAGARLPTEFEWEHAAAQLDQGEALAAANLFGDQVLHVRAAPDDAEGLRQMYGDAWEWTSSAYLPYPGYRPLEGALGEYNGKFMSGQNVLRGGSVATPREHFRPTYRNFFQPEKRWQFTGLRLARSLGT
ncbi:MAG: ergothioneine biosynthesis protein EgtB [Planctomycetes bacterium]|nr:ergothioneine biosynthesis protein EgtB [Planctomycetota bacterium]